MSSLAIGAVVFGLAAGGALLGMALRDALPERELGPDAKDVIKLAMGLIMTTAALVLGLMVASAKGAYDSQSHEIRRAAADLLQLDRTLAHYGPETQGVRDLVRKAVTAAVDATWPAGGGPPVRLDTPGRTPLIERIEEEIHALSPSDERRQRLRSRALDVLTDVQETRWLLYGGLHRSIPTPFLVVLVAWITVIFTILGLLAPRNALVVTVLLVCAVSISASVFLILEMDRPFEGIMRIPSAPLRYALEQLGQQ